LQKYVYSDQIQIFLKGSGSLKGKGSNWINRQAHLNLFF
jgi:hypothetical protein